MREITPNETLSYQVTGFMNPVRIKILNKNQKYNTLDITAISMYK